MRIAVVVVVVGLTSALSVCASRCDSFTEEHENSLCSTTWETRLLPTSASGSRRHSELCFIAPRFTNSKDFAQAKRRNSGIPPSSALSNCNDTPQRYEPLPVEGRHAALFASKANKGEEIISSCPANEAGRDVVHRSTTDESQTKKRRSAHGSIGNSHEQFARRDFLRKASLRTVAALLGGSMVTMMDMVGDATRGRRSLTSSSLSGGRTVANAAPPIAVIAEELGYFPVRNAQNETVMIPKRVQRESSQQAVELANYIVDNSRTTGVAVFTAYWCPHCARQRELWGREAWDVLQQGGKDVVVECSPRGYQARPDICYAQQIDGYPTWIVTTRSAGKGSGIFSLGGGGGGKVLNRVRLEGEKSLSEIADAVGFENFDPELEANVPPLIGTACQRPKPKSPQ